MGSVGWFKYLAARDSAMIEERGIDLDIEQEDDPDKSSEVFYNTDMVVNRDISTAALSRFADDSDRDELHALDALSATGVRALRYQDALGDRLRVTANDAKPDAVQRIRDNCALNGMDGIEVTEADAIELMAGRRKTYDFIDLDPFGSPVRFLDMAARSLDHTGLLGVTATDLAALCGTYTKTCARRYGSRIRKTAFCHEVGIRVLMKAVFESLARFNKVFRPKLCYGDRHYYRLIGEVQESKKGVNRSLDQIGYLQHCDDCLYRSLEEDTGADSCPDCGADLYQLGPLWIGRLGRKEFIEDVTDRLTEQGQDEAAEICGLLADEVNIRTPFYETHELAGASGIAAPKRDELIDALDERGYTATRTHFSTLGIRTTAPIDHIREEMRALKEE